MGVFTQDKSKIESLLKTVKDNDVKFIELWCTDVLGQLKSIAISPNELEMALTDGMGFDGSSIEGFARIDESDMVMVPDPDTFRILPWNDDEFGKVARMICDIKTPEGEDYQGDPRHALKVVLKKAADMGYTFCVGPELEFFYFGNNRSVEPIDLGGYFDLTPLDKTNALRRQSVQNLEKMGIVVEFSHHENAPSQQEIDMRYCEALKMADQVMTFKYIIKKVALDNNVYASFMPKPILKQNGSGMHCHQSLFKGDVNAFFDAKMEYSLSEVARQYTAGILKYAPEFTAITNQWVNSYKRLVPGYEAPVYLSWARRNRSDLVRIPQYRLGREKATRIELRSPDPACNPYLAFAVLLAAGLKGIEEKLTLPAPIEDNVFEMTQEERDARGIGTLPGTLAEALALTEKSALVKEALGDHIFNAFIENKKREWNEYRTQITEFEINRYLPIL